MDSKLLTAALFGAALAFSTAPASAQLVGSMGVPAAGSHGFRGVRPLPHNFNRCTVGDRRDVRRDGRFRCPFVDGFAYADGEWALYNNRAFEPDSYNDWWNDRPDRAFPRWVQEQHARGTCTPDRMWWSGSGRHC